MAHLGVCSGEKPYRLVLMTFVIVVMVVIMLMIVTFFSVLQSFFESVNCALDVAAI